MAVGKIPSPGSTFGPCKPTKEHGGVCNHPACTAKRRMAESLCQYCGEPIGYETLFYSAPDGAPEALVHATCLEASIERWR